MTDPAEFHARYADALRAHLQERGEASLAVGHELGRQALQDRISMLDIIENHFQLVEELSKNSHFDAPAALQFLLQTLAALDVATRGFLDSARRYEEQRARADRLADRDEFRSALVNSLQEGFFVADHRAQSSRSTTRSPKSRATPPTVCPISGRTRGWSTAKRPITSKPCWSKAAAWPTRRRSGVATAT
ncbi:phosphoserine phosphatase RsbU, N-terminal domain protein [Mycobacterium xenopi 4042]|uniref:Phosphoserine phosphatase RsbU, N-terminal domain protein n=1 Tax=Mycobacterium xenopi 4042 TaxID=1299334 RepID=X8AGY9_MYCXE|nr:phosphoserine phosphatase RsbU, N-terminal domain protein [Mycobacterium xenopi 4042]